MAVPIRILMCTCNGAAHLEAQLSSFVTQEHRDWALWVGDDGSTDATPEILSAFAAAHPGREVRILPGPRAGSARNFLALLHHPDLGDGYTAFSDQDDVWLPGKLARALEALRQGDPGRPAVYASRTFLTGPALENPRPSPLYSKPPGFGNALVQNILAGNTIVLNPAATTLLRTAGPGAVAADVPFHDWWVYLLSAGADARIIADPEPGLLYRQHGGNLMGSNRGLAGGLIRFRMITDSRFSGWVDRNMAALSAATGAGLLTEANAARLAAFAALRGCRGPGAVAGLRRLGIRRQTLPGDAMMHALAFSGKL